MATEAITPAAPASAPAASSSPAPSAPASSAPAPAAPSTSAPAAPAVSAPAVEAPKITGPTESESTAAFLSRSASERAKAEPAKADPAAPAVDPAAAVVDPAKPADPLAAAPAEAVKTPEEIAAAEAAKATEAAAEPNLDEEEFQLESPATLAPKDLAAKLKENPELAAQLEKLGLKDQLFAQSRLAVRTAAYEKIFPDVESAEYAAKASGEFSQLADRFTGIKDEGSVRDFLLALMPFSYQLDEEGQPVKDAAGQPVNDGSVGRFMDNAIGLALEAQFQVAKEAGDEDYMAAIDLLKARTGRSPASAVEEQLTDSQKQEAARLKTEREQIDKDKRAINEQKFKEFDLSVTKEIDSTVSKIIDGYLDKADLSDYNKKFLKQEIEQAAIGIVKNRQDFWMQLDELMRRPMTEKTRQARVALGLRVMKPILKTLAVEKFNAAGVKLNNQQAARTETIAAREQQNRSEQRGAGRPAAPAQMPTQDEIQKMVMTEFATKNGGREPSSAQLFSLMAQKRKELGAR